VCVFVCVRVCVCVRERVCVYEREREREREFAARHVDLTSRPDSVLQCVAVCCSVLQCV